MAEVFTHLHTDPFLSHLWATAVGPRAQKSMTGHLHLMLLNNLSRSSALRVGRGVLE